MGIADEIEAKLRDTFTPRQISVRDDSEMHRGHAGYQEGGESHFTVEIVSDAFAGMTRLGRHRAVHEALGKDILGRIHALALKISD